MGKVNTISKDPKHKSLDIAIDILWTAVEILKFSYLHVSHCFHKSQKMFSKLEKGGVSFYKIVHSI